MASSRNTDQKQKSLSGNGTEMEEDEKWDHSLCKYLDVFLKTRLLPIAGLSSHWEKSGRKKIKLGMFSSSYFNETPFYQNVQP